MAPTQPFEAVWLLFVLPASEFKNFTFCPHSVLVGFLWI